jgi:hypothetical protein
LDTKRENLQPGRRWSRQSHLVDGELVAKVVEDVVGGCGKAAGGCENKVGSHEEIGDVCCGDVARDGLVAAGGAVVCKDSLVIDWVNPNQFEYCFAEIRVGGAKIRHMNMGFGGGGNAS